MLRLALVLAALAAGSSARADDYFLTVFAAESVPFRPVKTHTFVVATRVPAGGGPVENHSISWLPATLKIRGAALRPERGVNLPIPDTLAMCCRDGMRVSVWGPYRVHPELFCRLRHQANFLSAGRVLYKGTDTVYPSWHTVNCYHAIWVVAAPREKYAGPFTCGDTTGGKTVYLFRHWIECPCRTHDEVFALIGVDPAGMVRRSAGYWPGRLDAIRSAVGR